MLMRESAVQIPALIQTAVGDGQINGQVHVLRRVYIMRRIERVDIKGVVWAHQQWAGRRWRGPPGRYRNCTWLSKGGGVVRLRSMYHLQA